MFCPVYKWKISQAVDSGETLPGKVRRHIARCDSCRKYAEFCASLKPRFTRDEQALLADFDESMTERIMRGASEREEPRTRAQHRTRILIPALAAAVTVLVVCAGVLFLSLPRSKPAPVLGRVSPLVIAASPENVLSKVESPLEREYAELKRTLESTSKVLISSLDFRIDRQ